MPVVKKSHLHSNVEDLLGKVVNLLEPLSENGRLAVLESGHRLFVLHQHLFGRLVCIAFELEPHNFVPQVPLQHAPQKRHEHKVEKPSVPPYHVESEVVSDRIEGTLPVHHDPPQIENPNGDGTNEHEQNGKDVVDDGL